MKREELQYDGIEKFPDGYLLEEAESGTIISNGNKKGLRALLETDQLVTSSEHQVQVVDALSHHL